MSYIDIEKGYFTDSQVDRKSTETKRMTLRAPAVANRLFDTLANAEAYINDYSDRASAFVGMMFSVFNDSLNNGVYRVTKIRTSDVDTAGTYEKVSGVAIKDVADLGTALEGYVTPCVEFIRNASDEMVLPFVVSVHNGIIKQVIYSELYSAYRTKAEGQAFTEWTTFNYVSHDDILYADLLALISNNELVPNSSYRITDYTTTTVQTDTQSTGHDFDIIVTALSTNELSEIASCIKKSGDTYFANAKLEAWEIKYCINNDTSRFAWADAVNGKGVIYYMKDEWGNECPYDFKNIQFNKLGVFLYTFGGATDDSLAGGCHHNIMMSYKQYSALELNANTFGDDCKYNTFGTSCGYNTFGDDCSSNTFGDDCKYNAFGNSCYYNNFGNSCYYNTLGTSCSSNTFGNSCGSNTFGNSCYSNTFGDFCYSNTFGNNCKSNTFGNNCEYNNFYAGTSGTTKKDYIKYIVLEDGCSYNNFYSTLTTSFSSSLQRIRIKGLAFPFTSPTNTQITLSEVNTKYEWLICYTSTGVLKQYCPND